MFRAFQQHTELSWKNYARTAVQQTEQLKPSSVYVANNKIINRNIVLKILITKFIKKAQYF